MRRTESAETHDEAHVDSVAPNKNTRKRVRFSETVQGHRTPLANAERAKCPPADINLHLYVSAPQGKRTLETHAQEPPTTCTDQSELFFETAEGSVQHEQSTAGTDESPADVQFETPTVPADRTSSITTDLLGRHQA